MCRLCVRVRGCVWVCTVQCVYSGVYCAYFAYSVFISVYCVCSVLPFVARCMPAHNPRAMPPSHTLHLPASQLMNEDRKQVEAERERTAYQVRLS